MNAHDPAKDLTVSKTDSTAAAKHAADTRSAKRMTMITESSIASFVTAFESFERDSAAPPAWLSRVRKAALQRFCELGVPTVRDEDWRFTNLSRLTRSDYSINVGPADIALADIAPHAFADEGWSRLVLLNGRYCASASELGELPRGVEVMSLAEALVRHGEEVERHLTKHADFDNKALVALNTAFLSDGAFVHVPRGVHVERPIVLLHVNTPSAAPAMSHPRTLIVADESSQVSLVESYLGLGDGVSFNNAVTELVAGPNANVDHYKVQRESEAAFHIGSLRIQQARDSKVSSHSLAVGGGLVRNEVHAVLDGEGADCVLNGLYVTHNDQHVDNHLRVEHAKPHCNSWEFYKGILDDRSSAVFTGRIFVHEDAQKTDAKQSNNNLLLSKDARIDTKPQLEIFADDVRCTHGATIGQLDDEAVFYLCSRGIDRDAARSILIYSFAGESLGQIKLEPLRDQLQKTFLERLPHGEMLRAGSPLFYGHDFAQHIRATDRRRESY